MKSICDISSKPKNSFILKDLASSKVAWNCTKYTKKKAKPKRY
jgi:hypothetical protein